jgi:hypothetical protein
MMRAATRLEDAKGGLEDCGVAISDLRQSWDEQVKAQSKPLPSAYVYITYIDNVLILSYTPSCIKESGRCFRYQPAVNDRVPI